MLYQVLKQLPKPLKRGETVSSFEFTRDVLSCDGKVFLDSPKLISGTDQGLLFHGFEPKETDAHGIPQFSEQEILIKFKTK